MKKLAIFALILCLSNLGRSQAPKPRKISSPAKPKIASARPPVSAATDDPAAEKAALDAAISETNATEKAGKIEQFLLLYPSSKETLRARESLTGTRAVIADEKFAAGAGDAAAALLRLALAEAPTPYSDRLFTEVISRIPAGLYWRGFRKQAVESAAVIEKNAASNINQLLVLANFYVSIENGDDAKRLAGDAIRLNGSSAGAYLILGHANRLNFALDEAAGAYSKALELESGSMIAMKGLAEMNRALGKPDAATGTYREILAKNASDNQARAGLVLSLFDAGNRAEAEAEMASALQINPANVVLLAGAAYWYAAQNEAARAVELGQRAVEAEPRYVWSHIALAHGLMSQGRPLDAERVLTGARKYGNFPTLEYEIAAARLTGGFYLEAASELAKSFVSKDGSIETKLGGRVPRSAKSFPELIAYERRAGMFEPADAENAETAERLKLLLNFNQALEASAPDETSAAAAGDEFIKGDDKMKLHRQLFVATALLQKRIAPAKVLELARAAIGNTDAALEPSAAAAAVMAGELYESRAIAFSRGDYLLVPDVPKQTLSAILRGRIEEIAGRALLEQKNYADAAVRLRRAVSVYPDKSAWQRSGMWNLGTALAAGGNEKEAVDYYIRSYKTDKPDVVKYVVVENLYRKVYGMLDGLEVQIGANPLPPPPAPTADAGPVKPENTPPAAGLKIEEVKAEPVKIEAAAEPAKNVGGESAAAPVPAVTAQPDTSQSNAAPAVDLVKTPEAAPPKQNDEQPAVVNANTEPAAAPAAASVVNETSGNVPPAETSTPGEKPPLPDASVKPKIAAAEIPPVEPVKADAGIRRYEVVQSDMPPAKPLTTNAKRPAASEAAAKATKADVPLFEPIIINVPDSGRPKIPVAETAADARAGSADDRPRIIAGAEVRADLPPNCTLAVSDDSVSVINDGGSVGVLVEVNGAGETELTARSSSPDNVEVKMEPENSAARRRRFYIIRSISTTVGLYEVTFTAPCGTANVKVRVR